MAISPDCRIPPSAITGTLRPPRATNSLIPSTAFITAVIWGTPTPVTTRVVQIEPGPMPTFTASAPASARSIAPRAVATLPAMTWMSCFALIALTVSSTFLLCPCAVSTTSTSAPAAINASTRSYWCGPTAAPQRSLPRSSMHASG